MILYLLRDFPAFVMYCVYENSRSSVLTESTDSKIKMELAANEKGNVRRYSTHSCAEEDSTTGF